MGEAKRKGPFGPTGDFPRGKLSGDDDGELVIGVTSVDNTIIIRFGTPVEWIGLDKAAALSLAKSIQHYAEKL